MDLLRHFLTTENRPLVEERKRRKQQGKVRINVVLIECACACVCVGGGSLPTFQSHRSPRTWTQSSLSSEFPFHQSRRLDRSMKKQILSYHSNTMTQREVAGVSVGPTGAGQRHHVGWLRRRADAPVVGRPHPELVVASGDESVDLHTLLPAAGHLLP